MLETGGEQLTSDPAAEHLTKQDVTKNPHPFMSEKFYLPSCFLLPHQILAMVIHEDYEV